MRHRMMWLVSWCVCMSTAVGVSAENNQSIDCGKKSLSDAVRDATDVNLTITFTGTCTGPIVIAIDGLTLKGVGTAVIDGGGQDAVTIAGSSRIALIDLDVTNGTTGIVVRDGAHVTLSGVVASNNGTGIAADNGAGLTTESTTVTNNTVRDVQLTFGTRADMRTTTVGTYTCDATVLIRGTSGIVCPH